MLAGEVIRELEAFRKSTIDFHQMFCENFPPNPLCPTAERIDLLSHLNLFLSNQTLFDFTKALFERACHKSGTPEDILAERDRWVRVMFDEREKLLKYYCNGQARIHGRKLDRSIRLFFHEGSHYQKLISFLKIYYSASPSEEFYLAPYEGIYLDEEPPTGPPMQPPIPWKSII